MEFLTSGTLGAIFGGIFRIIPEVLKLFDKVNERKHELNMFRLQTDLEKMRGEFRVEERYVDHSVAQLEAIGYAVKQQAEADKRAWKWVASVSALVRPSITYILFGMYVVYKAVIIEYAFRQNADWYSVLTTAWTIEDFAMLNMVLTFWFVGRAIEKYRNQ